MNRTFTDGVGLREEPSETGHSEETTPANDWKGTPVPVGAKVGQEEDAEMRRQRKEAYDKGQNKQTNTQSGDASLVRPSTSKDLDKGSLPAQTMDL